MMRHDNPTKIRGFSVRDVRFPTAQNGIGSDATYHKADQSYAYVIAYTDVDVKGHGFVCTAGRGTNLVVGCIKMLAKKVVGKKLPAIFDNFAEICRSLTYDSQMHFIDQEMGTLRLAATGIINALWDLWARLRDKPLWRLLSEMPSEQLVSTIDFRYIEDVLTREEAIELLNNMEDGKQDRADKLESEGYPGFTAAAGWIDFCKGEMERKVKIALAEGWRSFKVKVGLNLEDDIERCRLIRSLIGADGVLIIDASQVWGVDEAIESIKKLAEFKPAWVEEPTSPDDILGHAKIVKALKPLGIGVSTGRMAPNRVVVKQLLQEEAVTICQVDVTRLGGIQEALSVYLMARKFKVPVYSNASHAGVCDIAQHLQMWDYVSLSGTRKKRLIEYTDHLTKHIKFPRVIKHAHFIPPKSPGISSEFWEDSLRDHEYPYGPEWGQLFASGVYNDPRKMPIPWIESVYRG